MPSQSTLRNCSNGARWLPTINCETWPAFRCCVAPAARPPIPHRRACRCADWAPVVRAGRWSWRMGFRTDGYTAVPKSVRGSVDTPVASQYGSGTLRVERTFGNRGRVFLSGSLYGEDRLNGTPLQINDTTIRQLAFGTDYDSPAAGLFTVRLYGGTENYHQTFSSIAADRNSESLTNIQYVPSQQIGLLAQWSKQIASRLTMLAGLEGLYVQGFSNETTFSRGQQTARLA